MCSFPLRLIAIALVLILTFPLTGCGEGQPRSTPTDPRAAALEARITARPTTPTMSCTAGLHSLNIGTERDGQLFVPDSAAGKPSVPLVVMLHGAGGNRGILGMLRSQAEREGFAVLVPESRNERSWDLIVGSYGPDIEFLNSALQYTFARCNVDSAHLAIAGFSDGASYALSVGLTNGDLFTHIIAFSPGFSMPASRQGKPRVFDSHGISDRVLPIDRCSRPIVRDLRNEGYDVTYQEFEGGHEVPTSIADQATSWFLGT